MKKLALLLILAVGGVSLTNATDIITLNDGRVIRGHIVSQVDGQSITVEGKDGMSITYATAIVKSIRHEEDHDQAAGNQQCRGFRAMADAGVAYAFSDSRGTWNFSASATAGYQLNRMLFVGGGVQPIYVHHSRISHFTDGYKPKGVFLMPVYAMARVEKRYEQVTPFVELKVGDNFIGKHYKGVFMQASIGCRIKHVNIMASYAMQRAKGHAFYSFETYPDFVSSVGLRVGYDF